VYLPRPVRSTLVICCLLALALAAGCAPYLVAEPTRFYLLTPLEPEAGPPAYSLSGDPWIGLGPLALPRHLDRPQIVSRDGANRLRLAELDRWAAPLQDDMLRVLGDNMGRLTGSAQVVVYPWRGQIPVRYQVEVQILRLDAQAPADGASGTSGESGGEAVLRARWLLLDLELNRVLRTGMSDIRIPLPVSGPGGEYEVLAAAYSEALGRLSEEIARAVAAHAG
jgi:uncharacterized lipoprotein YmbA